VDVGEGVVVEEGGVEGAVLGEVVDDVADEADLVGGVGTAVEDDLEGEVEDAEGDDVVGADPGAVFVGLEGGLGDLGVLGDEYLVGLEVGNGRGGVVWWLW
jgi:hypothetical protein